MQNIEIKVCGAARGTVVLIDGQMIRRVRKVTLVHEVGRAPVLTLEIFALDGGTVAGEAEVETKATSLAGRKLCGCEYSEECKHRS